jgi:hypothetical protein
MITPEFALRLVLLLGVYGFVIGAMVMGGGVAAVRRQRQQLALLAVGFAAIVLLLPWLDTLTGGAIGIVGVGVGVLSLIVRAARRRREPAEAAERRAAAMRDPRIRWLVVGFVVFIVLMTVLAASLGRMSSP